MRLGPIKFENCSMIYHCTSRIVQEAPLLHNEAQEVMRNQLHKTAYFSGVKVLSYCIMHNHFHILIQVPARPAKISDDILIKRVKAFYGDDSFKAIEIREVLKASDSSLYNEALKDKLRQKYFKRMCDLSYFMQAFKQRFSIWYNQRTGRAGTLWEDRYHSIVVEDTDHARMATAAYIDLNPVRAGIVQDPKNYTFSGYANAMQGNSLAQEALMRVTGKITGAEAIKTYREILFTRAITPIKSKPKRITLKHEQAKHIFKEQIECTTLHDKLCLPMDHFLRGKILGSSSFVESIASKCKNLFIKRQQREQRFIRYKRKIQIHNKQKLKLCEGFLELPEKEVYLTTLYAPRQIRRPTQPSQLRK